MRQRTYEVPVDLMVEFAGIMEEHGMDNVIEGVNSDDDIQIRVDYEPEQKNIINKIHDMIDKYNENRQEDDDEAEDDEDNDDENEDDV